MFLFQGARILRFHVDLPGCNSLTIESNHCTLLLTTSYHNLHSSLHWKKANTNKTQNKHRNNNNNSNNNNNNNIHNSSSSNNNKNNAGSRFGEEGALWDIWIDIKGIPQNTPGSRQDDSTISKTYSAKGSSCTRQKRKIIFQTIIFRFKRLNVISSSWFQPIWKILVKMGIFPK